MIKIDETRPVFTIISGQVVGRFGCKAITPQSTLFHSIQNSLYIADPSEMFCKSTLIACLATLLVLIVVVDAQYLPYFGNGLGYGYNAYAFNNPYSFLYGGYYGKREAGFGPPARN